MPESTPHPVHPKPETSAADPLARFPEPVRRAHGQFLETGDPEALDTVILGIVFDHLPASRRTPGKPQPEDSARLIEDLGFDSLALAEVVFMIEDLYRVAISNEQLMTLATIGDLRTFVRTQAAALRKP